MEEPIALVFEDKDKLVKGFTEFFIDLLNQKEGRFSIALSGGSTPKVWFEYLAQIPKDDIDWGSVHVYWGDERCVPPDNEDSNYGMTKKHLLELIDIPEKNIHRIKGELKPEEASSQYEHELKANLSEGNIPVFDLVILGMGDDGHTASIFPHEINLWDSDDFCVVATHPTSGQQRVSLTGKVINSARSVAFLVTGKSKAEKIHEILETNDAQSPYPASLVNPTEGILYWFLDSLAASQLKDVE